MGLFKAIILGIVQGLTEFLPVSSSGHLTICKQLIGMEDIGFSFDIILHVGTYRTSYSRWNRNYC